ncbi:MAG TPA: DUF5916 domain-containing protein, partial [Candidatus Saccharimonadales bacterium]|nr:DUF5916 domain-containing protein [Candidatus Saccharimonadales bacterium]
LLVKLSAATGAGRTETPASPAGADAATRAATDAAPQAEAGTPSTAPSGVDEPANRPGVVHDAPFRIPQASSKIDVDGVLDEDAWKQALKLDLYYEVFPEDNVDAMVRTEAYLTYDASNVYAAFRASDPHPENIRARLSDRDAAFADDFVGMVLDTFNDGRRAFEFFVNPLGVQMDLIQDDVSGNEDSSWDAIWSSAGRKTDEGYVVEMAIPYTSLRFQHKDGDQTWGLDLIRIYPRDKRFLLASNPRNQDISCYLCQIAKIRGFSGATPGRNLEITPTVTAIRTDEAPAQLVRPSDPNSPSRRFSGRSLRNGDPSYDPGITVKWGMTPNLTLSGAVNPDFSQVEADAAQLDVNERFALFFREKRPFFLEGADLFSTPLQAVYTRTVADPKWGLKLTGKEGKNAIGVFAAQDEFTSVLFPASQGSSATSFENSVTDGVLRYRRDIGKSSTIGGLLTFREGGGDSYYNRVYGADTLLRLTDRDTLRAQFLGSDTRYPDEHPDDPNNLLITTPSDPNDPRDSFGQPAGDFTGQSWIVNYSHDTRKWGAWAQQQRRGNGFRADLGFVPQVDTRYSLAGYEYRWWGEEGKNWYSRLGLGSDFNETDDLEGNLIEREIEGWLFWQGPLQSYFNLDGGTRRAQFRAGRFAQPFVNLWYELRPTSDIWAGLSVGVSKRIDYAFSDPAEPESARQGDEFRIEPSLTVHLGTRLKADLSQSMRQLRIDEGRLFRENLSQLNLTYQLDLRTFFRAVLQYRNVDVDTGLYPECVADPEGCGLEKRTRGFFTQLLGSYKVNPQTAVYVGYTENLRGGSQALAGYPDLNLGLVRQDRTLFFKIGYAFVQ